MNIRLKAKDIAIGTEFRGTKHLSKLTGRIIANSCRSGDEVVVVEFDNSLDVQLMNVNDITPIFTDDRCL